MASPTGLAQGIPPDEHLDRLLQDVADLKTAVRTLSFLRGPMAFASPLRIGDLEIAVVTSAQNPAALDVTFRNVRSGGEPRVLWTIE